jgi:maleylpyruvate isomerase
MPEWLLHTYFRSSASFRVRIALNLKGIAYASESHHLQRGEQRSPGYLLINPQGLVPSLRTPDGSIIRQSMAIVEYLDAVVEVGPRLIPADSLSAARVRAIAQDIACDLHPINNLQVLNYLRDELELNNEAVRVWVQHWIHKVFGPLESELAGSDQAGEFCVGCGPTLADLCLVPQIFNAMRFDVDMRAYPRLVSINERCMKMPEFRDAAPDAQPDAA